MSSRDAILASVRRNAPTAEPLPDLDEEWIRYNDPRSQFLSTLKSVGGEGRVVGSLDDVRNELGERDPFAAAKQTCSLVDGLDGNVDLESVADPHELADLDVLVFPGEFAVAENGAIWLTDAGVRHRVAYFLAQHLVAVVPADAVVHNMHEAYDRIHATSAGNGSEAPFGRPGFGVFVSGPSKTADIEQSLVIGAHGARSLTVFLVESP